MTLKVPSLTEVRPEVAAFARLMELKLRKHDGDYGKTGWKNWNPREAWVRLNEEAQEVRREITPPSCNCRGMADCNHFWYGPNSERTALEAADVANFAMMIADTCGGLNLPAEDRPTVVCLCGSTRFSAAFREANLRETLAGKIVLTIGCDMRSDADIFGNMPEEELRKIKAQLDEIHKRKIDLADEVLILNVGGYVGDSTRGELEYAKAQGKQIRWLESQDDSQQGKDG